MMISRKYVEEGNMTKIKIILAILVGIMELSVVQADITENDDTEHVSKGTQDGEKEASCLAPYGIKLGQITIEEVKKKFSVLDAEKTEREHTFFLEPVDFNVGNLIAKWVIVKTIGNSNVVEAIFVKFQGKCYAVLKRILAKKYDVVKSNEPFVGDYGCLLKTKGNTKQTIFILQKDSDIDTSIVYYTNRYDEVNRHADEAEARKHTAEIENTL